MFVRSAVVLLLAAGAARAQTPVLTALTRAQGAPSDYVFAVHQDRHGFVWLGTDAGLARYDGRDVRTWTTADGLPDNLVYAIAEGPDGRLHVGTFGGAAVLEPDGRLRREAPGGPVGAVAFDGAGRRFVVAGTTLFGEGPGGLRRHSPTGADVLPALMRTAQGGLAALLLDGRLLTVGAGREAARHPALVPGPSGLPPAARPLFATADGRFLAADDGRAVFVWDRARRARVDARPLDRTRSFRDEGGGRFVVGTERGEVWRFTPGAGLRRVLGTSDTGGHPVTALAHDYEGGLWVGLFGGGARRLAGRHLRRYGDDDPRLARPLLHLHRDRAGTVWGTSRQGLVGRTADGGAVERRVFPVGRIVDRPAGGHYVSGGTTLSVADGGRLQPVAEEGNWISSLLVGPADTLWVGTYGSGVRRFVRDRPTVTPPLPGGVTIVEDLVPGAGGAVWALTRSQGALRHRAGRWTTFRAGLPSDAVFSVLERPDGTVWFGTDRGLARWQTGAVRAFDGGGRLRGQRLHALFATGDTVWAVADRALVSVVGDSLRVFGAPPLVPASDAVVHHALAEPGGRRVLLATSAGLVGVDVRAFGRALPTPRVAFLGADGAAPADTVRLAAGVRGALLAFAPLSFAGPARLQHRTDGGPWSAPTAERTLALAGLADGAHTVEVRAVNADGVVSARPARVALVVVPPWWRTPWARGAALAGLVAAVALAARALSTARLRRRLRALEVERRLHDERERISRDLHDHVGAQLTGVLAGLDLLGDGGPPPDGLVGALRGEVRETMGALRTTILTLRHPPASFDDLGALLDRYVRDQARFHARPRLGCTVEGALDRPLAPVEALHLFRIVQEAVANALRHSGAGRVDVRLVGHGRVLTLTVEDDGAFRPADGLGHGIATMRTRAAEAGAALDLAGTPAGTRVAVTWPAFAAPGPSLAPA